ncbi:hypothetical protein COT65_01585 [Candidatus Shapirobacteria bacterium CG09_land_8_20_14_0_10_47_13]|uniref:ADP-dependent (S)-NAD(P)H-hydrate dehydratase n=1 Tax=Candidatus Shapirobacteria bacterium CG09_land_8_20_14_0_10_47_13 TaxID=1974481 RepID=A0A2H0WMN0_9BACT|nr:MAG: hypothetical protein COT65_01585 [Candidatus Shapirobacteria bacterium CG09_land_8_20_14_0_10_47_13]
MQEFNPSSLRQLFRPGQNSSKEDNGQVTIIGGSSLFHGAPLLALKTASRIVDMVFFASPELGMAKVATELKSRLSAFILVPWKEIDNYLAKSEAVLIGPGLMRYHRESKDECDKACQLTKKVTETLLTKFPQKQWVIDGGSLQVMDPEFIPKSAIITPNKKEYRMLFGEQSPETMAKKYRCLIVAKGVETLVYSPTECVSVKGGNAGLTKGGTGDVLAGLTVALAAKNPPFLAACAASYLVKKAADELYGKVGFAYNADDLADKAPEVLGEYFR